MSTSPVGPRAQTFGVGEFICSKPLQALHCASIARSFDLTDARLTIVTAGIHGKAEFLAFFESSDHGGQFSHIASAPDHTAALHQVRSRGYDSLFIEDDRVSMYRLLVQGRTRRMVLFEEGLGTYIPRYRELQGLRWLKWKILSYVTGCGLEFGHGRLTDIVMVTRPSLYVHLHPDVDADVVGFPGVVQELRHEPRWREIVGASLDVSDRRLGSVVLVLGTWGGVDETLIQAVAEEDDHVFYKPHPHDGKRPTVRGVNVLERSWMPAEVHIEALAALSESLKVIHFGSSAAFYTQESLCEVEFIDL